MDHIICSSVSSLIRQDNPSTNFYPKAAEASAMKKIQGNDLPALADDRSSKFL